MPKPPNPCDSGALLNKDTHCQGPLTGGVSKRGASRSGSVLPFQQDLNVGACNAQEFAAGKCHFPATPFFFNVAVQLFVCCNAAFGTNDVRIAEKRMLQCSFCSAAFQKLQRNFRFRSWHVAGVGFRGVGFQNHHNFADFPLTFNWHWIADLQNRKKNTANQRCESKIASE